MIISGFTPLKHLSRVFLAVGLFVSSALSAATFTVTNVNDSGAGSLRDAINQVNAGAGNDTIAFNIPGAGVHTIMPATDLPAIVQPNTLVDGYTQPGTSVNTDSFATNAVLLIEIKGQFNDPNFNGLTTGKGISLGSGSTGSTIRGLILNTWLLNAINISGSANSKVYGNFIGTDASGAVEIANRCGVFITGSTGVIVGSALPADRNLIIGSFEFISNGYGIVTSSNGAIIKGNIIGLDRTGTVTMGNASGGIRLAASNCLVGGATAADRNVISGQNIYGINVIGSSNNLIQGNYIGTDVYGQVAHGNKNAGIIIAASSTTAAVNNIISDNVISGNGNGMQIGFDSRTASQTANNNHVIGNLIGTDASGTTAIPNTRSGIRVVQGNNFVGGSLLSDRNIISGNLGDGILICASASNTTVYGNFIGLDITGALALGNKKNGVRIGINAGVQSANNNAIGGPNAGEGNVISGNGQDGILVSSFSHGNIIAYNYIGYDASGTFAVPNKLAAIRFRCAPENFFAENLIAFNKQGVIFENKN